MKKRNCVFAFSRIMVLMLLAVTASLSAGKLPEWQSQYAMGLNKLEPHYYVLPYASEQEVPALNYKEPPYYLDLNGKWRFHWVRNPDLRPKTFFEDDFFDLLILVF